MLMEVHGLNVALVVILVIKLGVLSMIGLIDVTIVVLLTVSVSIVSSLIRGCVIDDLTALVRRSDRGKDSVLMEVDGLNVALVVILVVKFGVLSVIRLIDMGVVIL